MIPVISADAASTTVVAPSVTHGAYVGPDAKLTSLAGSAALLAGGQAGWVIDHLVVLGGAAYALAGAPSSPLALQPASGPEATLSLAYGGGRVAVVPGALQRLHVVLGVLVGGGRVSSSSSAAERVSDGFYVVEPDAAFEANLAPPVRLAVGASYRITGGTGIASLGPTAMNGPSVFLTIKVGAF